MSARFASCFLGLLATGLVTISGAVAEPAPPPSTSPQPALIEHFAGANAPQLSFQNQEGATATLSDFKGKLVIVNLWASWCAPCRMEMPSLAQLARAYPDKLVVVAISQDQGGWPAINRFWSEAYSPIQLYLSPSPAIAQHYGALGLPYTIVLDRNGREIGRLPRAAEWDQGALRALIDRAVD